MHKKSLLVVTFLISFVAFPLAIHAQTDARRSSAPRAVASSPRKTPADREAKLKELRAANTAKRCEIIKERAAESVDKYQELQGRRLTRYSELLRNLTNTITKLKAAGIDTSKLESAFSELKQLIDDYIVLHARVQTTLESYRSPNCSELSSSEYRAALTAVQGQIKDLNNKAKEIQEFLGGRLKEILEGLRSNGRRTPERSATRSNEPANRN